MRFMRYKYVRRVRRLQRNRVNRILLSRRYYGLQPGYSNQEIQLAFPACVSNRVTATCVIRFVRPILSIAHNYIPCKSGLFV